MGMFDDVKFDGRVYQSKDTPAQFLGEYEIRGNELWFNDIKHQWIENDNSMFGGYLEPVSSEWVRVKDFTGALTFGDGDREFVTLFWEGEMIKVKEVYGREGDY